MSNFNDIGQCLIFVAILKMATAKNFSMLEINSGHHNLPTYEMSLKLDNVEFVRHNCNYSAILATLQITSYALGV